MMNQTYVLLAAAANFVLGGIWYAVFGKAWMKELKLKASDLNPKNPVPYLISFGSYVLNAYALKLILFMKQPQTWMAGFAIGAAVWFFFLFANAAKHYAFSGRSIKLFAIDYVLDLLGMEVMTAILFAVYFA